MHHLFEKGAIFPRTLKHHSNFQDGVLLCILCSGPFINVWYSLNNVWKILFFLSKLWAPWGRCNILLSKMYAVLFLKVHKALFWEVPSAKWWTELINKSAQLFPTGILHVWRNLSSIFAGTWLLENGYYIVLWGYLPCVSNIAILHDFQGILRWCTGYCTFWHEFCIPKRQL